MKYPTLVLATASALALSACGGGGGSPGGTSSAPPPVQTSPLTPITAANASKAASSSYTAGSLIGDSSTSVTGVLTGVSIGGTGIGAVSPVISLVKRAVGQGTPLLTGVTSSQACSGGGTVSIDANLHGTQSVSNGDTMSVTAKNCVEDGNTLNGAMSITFSGVSGDIINSWVGAATMDTRFTAFSIVAGNETATINGDMKIVFQSTSASAQSITVSGKSLQATDQKAGSAAVNMTLADYSLTANISGSTISSAGNYSLSGSSSSLGQFAYTVKSIQPFVSTGTAMPASGSMIVNGNASSVTVTALNSSSVRLDYSAKGDGVITQSTTVSWAEFLASL